MQRLREYQNEPPDSPALESYVLHDYLVAARLRRKLMLNPGDSLDSGIDAFLQARGNQPVTRALRHDWLSSLAARKRWDWFLPRAADANDPQLACDRLAGRLSMGDETGLAGDALLRWISPQRQPDECNPVFEWLRSQGDLTAALAETRTRAALAADNPRLAQEFLADVPEPYTGPLVQWIQLLEAPKAAIALLSLEPNRTVESDALVAGFSRLSGADNAAASSLLPALLKRPDMTSVLRSRLQRALALGAASSRMPGAVEAFADRANQLLRRAGTGVARARGAVGGRLRERAAMDGGDA